MQDDLESEFELCSASLSKSTEALKTKLQNMKQADDGLSASKCFAYYLILRYYISDAVACMLSDSITTI